MNEQVRSKKPERPVIVCQDGADGEQRESNNFLLMFRGQPIGRVTFDRNGLAEVESHEVVVWVELEDDVDVVDADAPAVVAPKKPRRALNIIDSLTRLPGRRK